jgi:hypothetical protein
MYLAALLISGPAVYSGKYFLSGTCNDAKARSQHSIDGAKGSLLLKTSILLRKRMIDVRGNHRELITLSKRTSDSAIRFCGTKGAVRGSSTKRQNGVNSLFSTHPKAPGHIRSARCKK